MTQKSKTYYAVRSTVRFTFWTTVAILSTIGLGAIADRIDSSDENRCPVVLERNFTWNSSNGEIVNIYSCQHPVGVRLLENGRWEWSE